MVGRAVKAEVKAPKEEEEEQSIVSFAPSAGTAAVGGTVLKPSASFTDGCQSVLVSKGVVRGCGLIV